MTTAEGLRLTGLTKVLGGRTIVDDLHLDVAPGELVCLLGPSGCGKTTTLRMIAGFLIPEQGTVTMGGREVTRLSPDRRPSAMVFQNYALWPHMTVARNVAYPLRLAKVPRAEVTRRVDAALEMVNLIHHKDSRPGRISGGEQQRVALARALVQEPSVLLLDEPLSNLDAKLRVKVRDDIREIQQRLGITTVMVTHDQDEAMAMSDRVAVMHGGRILQVSPPAELYAEPADEFVATFVGQLNRVDGRWTGERFAPVQGLASGVRPEDVLLVAPGSEGSVPGRVERVTPHGHFTEAVVCLASGESLRSYLTGPAPTVAEPVGVVLRRVMTFEDGRRTA